MDSIKYKQMHKEGWFNCICDTCGKPFHDKPSHMKKCTHHYCSKECHYKAKTEYMKGCNNHQYGLKGDKNASWKSDKHISRYGYIQIRKLDHPFRDSDDFVFEHRLVAEEFLLNYNNSVEINGKKYLHPDYVVHHINFNRQDNRVENLMILTKQQHQQLHNLLNNNKRNPDTGRFESQVSTIKPKRTALTGIVPKKISDKHDIYSLYADNDTDITISRNHITMIDTYESFSIPNDINGFIFWTYGIAPNQYFDPHMCVGVFSNTYEGAISIFYHNETNTDIIIKPHSQIAIIYFTNKIYTDLEIVDSLAV